MTEHVFCCRCLRVQPCRVEQTLDKWYWYCMVCGALADEEWKDYEDDVWEAMTNGEVF